VGIFIHIYVIFSMQDAKQIYSQLLELKYPWKVNQVSLDPKEQSSRVPSAGKECMVYDHLGERMWRDLDSIGFRTCIWKFSCW
jgi:hypothetical protein